MRKSRPRKSADRRRRRRCTLVVITLVSALSLIGVWAWLLSEVIYLKAPPPSIGDSCPSYGCPIPPLKIESGGVQEALATLSTDPMVTTAFSGPNFATVTWQSNQHEYNQDRSVLIQPYDTHQTPQGQASFLACIFDGHGVLGHQVAQYAVTQFPHLLAERLNQRLCCQSDEWIMEQLNATFLEIDRQAPDPSAWQGGCTGSVTLRQGNKLFFANAGDSLTILTDYHGPDQVDIPFQTRKDKANLPDERARIEALGGKIHIPPNNPFGSRVVVFSTHAAHPELMGLAMSRSIGDWEWGLVGVTAEPRINVVSLSNLSQPLVIAASDGLFDLRRPQFYAKRFGQSFYSSGDGSISNYLKLCVDTIYEVSPKNPEWYRDDISVIAIRPIPSAT